MSIVYRSIRGCMVLVLASLATAFLIPAAARAGLDEEVSQATDRGIEFLLKAIEKNQWEWPEQKNGEIALETYALLVAGVSQDHPLIQKNFEFLSRIQLDHTYTVSCYIFALDAAISQIHGDLQFFAGRAIPDSPKIGAQYRDRLEKAVNALVRMKQPKIGGWNYGAGGSRYDNSNTQFAVLALGVGAKRKVPIPNEIWEDIFKHFSDGQDEKGPEVKERIELYPPEERGEAKKDRITVTDKDKPAGGSRKGERKKDPEGKTTVVVKPVPEFGEEDIKVFARGWHYSAEPGGASWNMTCAGLSSLILAADNLRGKIPIEMQNKLNTAIRDGFGWVMSHWNPFGGGGWKYYGIYSLEKVADLGEVKKFGSHDWYDEVARHVIGEQTQNGSWPGDNPANVRINSSFALLVLNRATTLLTQRANSIIITGPGAKRQDQPDIASWVYIQSMDRWLHIPSVFRLVRLRPSARVREYIDLVVDNYLKERDGLLIPHLITAYEYTPYAAIKKVLIDNMKKITGTEYEETEKYHQWFRRWKDVVDIGDEIKKSEIPYLIKYYEHTNDSAPLRKKIIWALSRCQAKEAAPMFIADLGHADQDVRKLAYIGLQSLPFLKEPPPPFDAKAPAATRDSQIKAIGEWYERVKA